MNIVKSINSRLNGIKQDFKSRYWEYGNYFKDQVVWEQSILFESFGGLNFQGNPYYIFKEIFLNNKYKKYDLYISHQCPEKLKEYLNNIKLYDNRVKVIKIHSDEYRRVLSHCKYLVNNVSFNMNFIKKTEQVYLNTWHGTPLKCLGRNIQNDPFECNNAQRNFLLCDYLLAPNKLTRNVYENDYMVRGVMHGQIKEQGYPRNSIFFDQNKRQSIKKRYGLEGKISIFYMPTWRGTANGIDDVDQVSEMERLAKELGETYKVFVKFHPAMQKEGAKFKYCLNMPDNIEVYEFLNGMDILITDYSSVFFDFANSDQKIILYQYDQEQYYKSRGMYSEVANQLPFPIAFTYEELKQYIKTEESTIYTEFKKQFCPFDSLKSTEEAIQLLMNFPEQAIGRMPVDLYIIDFLTTDEMLLKMAEKIKNKNFRFVFIPKRSNKRFSNITCFDKINYLILYPNSKLTIKERIIYLFSALVNTKKHLYYMKREQKRLWGATDIGHIYSKTTHVPIAVKAQREEWPNYL